MGNISSSQNSIWVQCERPSYFSGDVVRGAVCLNCIDSIDCTGIELEVTGYEKASFMFPVPSVTYSANGQAMATVTYVPHYARYPFFYSKAPLGPECTLPPGQYQYGFAFRLPEDAPSSMVCGSSSLSFGSIVYKVKAVCHTRGALTPAVKHRHNLTVYGRLQPTPSAPAVYNEGDVVTCGCFRQGRAWCRIDMDSDHYVPGEVAQVAIQIENHSSAAFRKVEVKLMSTLTLRAQGRTMPLTSVDASYKFGKVPKNTTLREEQALKLELPLPANLVHTTTRSLVSCCYWVDVLLAGDGCSDLRVWTPIVIHPAQPPPEEEGADGPQQLPPEWWAPRQVFDTVLL